jgi:hypothetical protein
MIDWYVDTLAKIVGLQEAPIFHSLTNNVRGHAEVFNHQAVVLCPSVCSVCLCIGKEARSPIRQVPGIMTI